VPESEIVSMPMSAMFSAAVSCALLQCIVHHDFGLCWTSSNITPPSRALVRRAALLGMDAGRLDEFDAPLAQRRDGREHIGRAERDALQQLFALRIEQLGIGAMSWR
jgi:hypothetical protein